MPFPLFFIVAPLRRLVSKCVGASVGIIVLAALTSLSGASLSAQHLAWKAGRGLPGPTGSIQAATWWDPDGLGPRGKVLVVGGTFTLASRNAVNLAWVDLDTGVWGTLPTQPDLSVRALAARADGTLAVGGYFNNVGSLPAANLAIWNGASWSSPGGGCTGFGRTVKALLWLPNGDLVAGGTFDTAGGVLTGGLAQWNGAQWSSIGGVNISVSTMLLRSATGHLVVGGGFYGGVAEWNGFGWNTLVPGIPAEPTALIEDGNGDLVASTLPGGVRRWNGTAWQQLGSAPIGFASPLLPLGGGSLLAAGVDLPGFPSCVALWDGATWSLFANSLLRPVLLEQRPNGDLLAVGELSRIVPIGLVRDTLRGVAIWRNSAWQPLWDGFDNTVSSVLALPDGSVFAFGSFLTTQDAQARHAARNSSGSWSELSLPGGSFFQVSSVTCAALDAGGQPWIAVDDPTAPYPARGLHRWNGVTWSPVAQPIATVTALDCSDAAHPVVGRPSSIGTQSVLRWSGTAWQPLGAGLDGSVLALVRRGNGDLVAAGGFQTSGATATPRVARWNGVAWSPLGSGFDDVVRTVIELPNGDLVAGGDFRQDSAQSQSLDHIARWDGTAWQALGSGLGGGAGTTVAAVVRLPNGDLVVGGQFDQAGDGPGNNLARWDGQSWTDMGAGLDGPVTALSLGPTGDLHVAGNFSMAGGVPAAHYAFLRTDRRASVAPYGTACAGSAGLLSLTGQALPWQGAQYRSVCQNAAANALGLDVFGLAAVSQPLTIVHPSAGANCSLLTAAVFAILRLPTNGTFLTDLAIPSSAALLGESVYQQMVVLEPGIGSFGSLASSNGLQVTIGAL